MAKATRQCSGGERKRFKSEFVKVPDIVNLLTIFIKMPDIFLKLLFHVILSKEKQNVGFVKLVVASKTHCNILATEQQLKIL